MSEIDIFISYAREDKPKAQELARVLERLGWSVWWDRYIPAGRSHHDVIEEALDRSRCVVVLWSRHSVRSRWVLAEAEDGLDREVLVPALLEKVRPRLVFRGVQAADLTRWSGDETASVIQSLIADIERIAGPARPRSGEAVGTGLQARLAGAITSLVGPAAGVGSAMGDRTARPHGLSAQVADGVEMEFVQIEPGEFTMGSDGGPADDDEKPARTVRISKGFQLGKYPVTQQQWEAVMGDNPSLFKGPKRPVERVSWDKVQDFIAKLNERQDGFFYRLPSEAEWEYAARAGTTDEYAGKLEEMAWYDKSREEGTSPVGEGRKPNAWGLYDMLGNVWEWVRDWYAGDYYQGRPDPDVDPQGPEGGAGRVFRGGGWFFPARFVRAACRRWFVPAYRFDFVGFRCARVQKRAEP